ncbi:MAG: Fibronectin type domain [Bacillales bacterium]|jgi:hypothetical protein|nr:Fibronectin type domain [Bacillales bacterium]
MSIIKIKKLTILAAILVLINLCINFNGMSVFAATGTDQNGFTWQSGNGSTCYITGYTGGATNITIPSSIDGYTVTGVGNLAFNGKTTLTNVSIPSTVTSIGSYAFQGCSLLSKVNVPESVTNIGDHAFQFCTNLTEINIPNGVASIGSGTFNQCKALASITIPSSVTSIGDNAFFECLKITSVTIPNGVTFIGESAFANCKSLEKVYMPDSVTSIGKYTFNDCFKLASVRLSNKLTSIVDQMFCRNWALKSIELPSGITRIGVKAFEECGLTSITIPNGVTSIGGRAFIMCQNLSNVTIPNSVRTIEFNAFAHCYSFTNIVIPSSVTSIGDYAFYFCKNLTEISIPNSVSNIGFLTFDSCNSNFKIKGFSDSKAQAYAQNNKITFQAIPTNEGSNNNSSQTPPAQNQGSNTSTQGQGSNPSTQNQVPNSQSQNQSSSSNGAIEVVSKEDGSKKSEVSISVSPNTINLKVGNKQTLVATVLPTDANNSVTWTSSDESVAVVDSTGVITAKGIGVTTITAKVGTKISTCVVIVANKLVSLYENDKKISITADQSVLNSAVNFSVSHVDHKKSGLNSKYIKKYSVKNCFDFKLKDKNGKEVEPTDYVMVTIPLSPSMLKSASSYFVIYIDDNGTAHEIKPTIDGSNLNFTTDHFSRYAIVTKITDNDKRGVNDFKTPVIFITIILSAMIGIYIFLKQKVVLADKK